ncbi:hypothetical protein BGW41_001441 [Actinomortierella wolfii]|nr:hypothetical protein BGW41_001441 [Actinomortierella wolfii]
MKSTAQKNSSNNNNNSDNSSEKSRRQSHQHSNKLAKDDHDSWSVVGRSNAANRGHRHRPNADVSVTGQQSGADKVASEKNELPSSPKSSKIPASAYYNAETKTFWPRKPIRSVTPSYLVRANEPPKTLDEPRKHLVILDLNGTLFYRTRTARRTITMRPYLPEFLKFLFHNFRVMVWSSATPPSVEAMLHMGLGQYIERLDRVWTRQDFDLDEVDYNRKVLTLKDLEIVWRRVGEERKQALKELEMKTVHETEAGAAKMALPEKYAVEYDQTNTILIDDSYDKSQLQKHNCIVLADFDQERAKAGNDVELLKVKSYLSKLAYQENVSAYMRMHPFCSEKEPVELPDSNYSEAKSTPSNLEQLAAALARTRLDDSKGTSA